MLTINRHPSRAQLWWFAGLWLPLFGGAMGSSLYWRIHAPTAAALVWGSTVAATFVSLLSGEAARLVFLGLSYATFPIGFVVGWVSFAVIYFVVLTPLGLAMRLVGRDALQLTGKGNAESYWKPRTGRSSEASRSFRQF
jgi:hypothetical protein